MSFQIFLAWIFPLLILLSFLDIFRYMLLQNNISTLYLKYLSNKISEKLGNLEISRLLERREEMQFFNIKHLEQRTLLIALYVLFLAVQPDVHVVNVIHVHGKIPA